jgi:hypothetical protein
MRFRKRFRVLLQRKWWLLMDAKGGIPAWVDRREV